MRKLSMFALMFVATAASAQGSSPRPGLSEACRTEVMNLCPAGGERGARRECMMANRDKISEGCRGELRNAMQARRNQRGASGGAAPTSGPSTTAPVPQ